jgi:hypothetical protein
MFLRFRSIYLIGILLTALAVSGWAQTETPNVPVNTPKPTPAPKTPDKITTAEQAVENSIFLYGFPGGRNTLNQIRKTTLERGTSRVASADGKLEQTSYQRYVIRAETLDKEKIRLDQAFPSASYSLVYDDGKIFGIYNNTVFTPREDALKTFENQIVHGLEALLRYKENESKIDLAAREKVMGVDYFVIDLTDKQQRKTRYYMSSKTFRVMMLTYEDGGVNYRRKFYDYNYAQGTLVPYQTILWANDKVVEDTEVGTITFGQKVDEQLFAAR